MDETQASAINKLIEKSHADYGALHKIADCLYDIYIKDMSTAERQICDILISRGIGQWGKSKVLRESIFSRIECNKT